MNGELACAVGLLGLIAITGIVYALRVLVFGATKHERVESAGVSALLGRSSMEATYFALGPLASLCVRLGISANAITAMSLLFGIGAGVLVATNHLGFSAIAMALASLADALDGLVARKTQSSSDAGEVFDAAVDRYVEFFFLAGLAVRLRADVVGLAVVLAAISGSFMVSYSTAKAEAMQITPPRGAMRRAERAVVLFLGTVLAPVAALWIDPHAFRGLAPVLTLVGATAIVAIASNVSAVLRLRFIARTLRERDRALNFANSPNVTPISHAKKSRPIKAARPRGH